MSSSRDRNPGSSDVVRTAAIAFAPHSGWAALVALGGDPAAPQVLARDRIEMADPTIPGSKQPYHEAEGMPLPKAEALLRECQATAERMAVDALRVSVAELRRQGFAVQRSGIVLSSGRQGGDLAAILASHALIHTADGEHFRHALRHASEACGLAVTGVRERELAERARGVLRSTPTRVQAAVAGLGRTVGPPWGADQKKAALLAWMLLADAEA
jgi:hypothetical protein